MACCILGALIMSQLFLIWDQFKRLLGLRPVTPPPPAAEWSPFAEPALPQSPLPATSQRWRVISVTGLSLSLGATLVFEGHHLREDFQAAGVSLGLIDAPIVGPGDAVICGPATAVKAASLYRTFPGSLQLALQK